MKALWIIGGLAGLGALLWYMGRNATPVGTIAASQTPIGLPSGYVTPANISGVAQAIASGGTISPVTTAPGFQLIATLHPPASQTKTLANVPAPTQWRKV